MAFGQNYFAILIVCGLQVNWLDFLRTFTIGDKVSQQMKVYIISFSRKVHMFRIVVQSLNCFEFTVGVISQFASKVEW